MYENDFKLKFDYWDAEDVVSSSFCIYQSDGNVYYERHSTACSTNYFCTYKFDLREMTAVLHFIADNGCDGLEEFIDGLESADLVSYEYLP